MVGCSAAPHTTTQRKPAAAQQGAWELGACKELAAAAPAQPSVTDREKGGREGGTRTRVGVVRAVIGFPRLSSKSKVPVVSKKDADNRAERWIVD